MEWDTKQTVTNVGKRLVKDKDAPMYMKFPK